MKSREKRLLIVSGIAAILFVVIVILSLPPLRHSVFPTKEDKLFVAIWNADTNSVANLLAAGANPNSIAWSVRRATPLIDAVRFGHLVIKCSWKGVPIRTSAIEEIMQRYITL